MGVAWKLEAEVGPAALSSWKTALSGAACVLPLRFSDVCVALTVWAGFVQARARAAKGILVTDAARATQEVG